MRRSSVVRATVGFLLSGLALWGFLAAVGLDRVRAELAGADPALVAAGVVAALLALACWSEAQRLALSTRSGPIGGNRFRLAYLAGTFAKLVLPMGHVSGPAITAYAVGSSLDVSYEDALAAITVSDLLNLIASILLAAVGVAVFLLRGSTADPDTAALAPERIPGGVSGYFETLDLVATDRRRTSIAAVVAL